IASNATGARVTGNYIGTNAAGTSAVANHWGVAVSSAHGVVIGGTTSAARNVISGNNGINVFASGHMEGSAVQGNYIGTNAGGATPGAGNTIAYSPVEGISVTMTFNFPTSVAIEGNSIYHNGGLGIDINGGGTQPNNAGDNDIVQNHPNLTSVSVSLNTVTVN